MPRRRVIFTVLCIEIVLVWLIDHRRRRSPIPPDEPLPYLLSITSLSASPSTITFTSSDPDAVASASATIQASTTGGTQKAWRLQVDTQGATTLTGCSSVPVSAITAVCNSVSFGGTGGKIPTGTCAAPFPLSTVATQVAGGMQGDKDDIFTINMTYQFADAWKYKGANSPPCTLTLNYTFSADT